MIRRWFIDVSYPYNYVVYSNYPTTGHVMLLRGTTGAWRGKEVAGSNPVPDVGAHSGGTIA